VFKDSLQLLKEEVEKNIRVTLSLDCRERELKLTRDLQHFLKIKPKNVSNSQMELLLNHCIAAEKSCPGSGVKFLELFISKNEEISSDVEIRTKFDCISIINEQNFSREVTQILKEVIDLVNLRSKISIKKSKSSKKFIELSEGYNFRVARSVKISDAEMKNVSVCCIDGFVENVSEIHHLLTYLSEKRQGCLMFFRGATDDVLNTIKVNYDRQTLLMIPYVVPYDLENVNTLVDIAVVSGTDVISSTKGQTISSIDEKRLGFFETCYCSGSNIIGKNSTTSERVSHHIQQLKNKAEENFETQSLIYSRINSLTASCIDINLPDDMNFLSLSNQLDKGIRIISSVVNKTYFPNKVAKRYYESWLAQTSTSEQFLL